MQDPVVVDAVSKYSNKRAIGGKTTPHPQQFRGGICQTNNNLHKHAVGVVTVDIHKV